VEDLTNIRRRLEQAGCTTTDDQPLEGYQRCYVDDPFGNRTELLEPE